MIAKILTVCGPYKFAITEENKMNFKRDTDYNEAEIDRLISWIKTLKIPGKAEMLHTLKKLKPYARIRPLKDSPESSLFTILNRIGYLDESEELCSENE